MQSWGLEAVTTVVLYGLSVQCEVGIEEDEVVEGLRYVEEFIHGPGGDKNF